MATSTSERSHDADRGIGSAAAQGMDRFEFATEEDYLRYPRADVTPPPSRTEEEKLAIGKELYEEQQRMAAVEPEWAQQLWTKRAKM